MFFTCSDDVQITWDLNDIEWMIEQDEDYRKTVKKLYIEQTVIIDLLPVYIALLMLPTSLLTLQHIYLIQVGYMCVWYLLIIITHILKVDLAVPLVAAVNKKRLPTKTVVLHRFKKVSFYCLSPQWTSAYTQN